MAANAEQKKAGRLSTREKVLIAILLIGAVVFVYLYFFLFPLRDDIAMRELDKDIVEMEYNEKTDLVARKDEIEAEHEALEEALAEEHMTYFPTSNQEHYIKIFELEIIADNDLDIRALTFQEPSEVNVMEEMVTELYATRVLLPYEGSYEGLRELIRRLETSEERIRINNLSITEDEETEEVFGNMSIDFFSIPRDYEYPWNGELPDYGGASAYDRSLFYFSAQDLPPEENDVDEPDEEEPENGNGDNGNEATDDPEEDDDEDEGSDDDEEGDPGADLPDFDDADYITYRVEQGDTLNQISLDNYGTTAYVGEIMELNNITNPRRLLWGTTIRLPRP